MPTKIDGPFSSTASCPVTTTKYPVTQMNGRWVCGCTPSTTASSSQTTVGTWLRTRSWTNTVPWPTNAIPKPVNTYSDVKEETKSRPVRYRWSNEGAVCGGTGICLEIREGLLATHNFRGDGALNNSPILDETLVPQAKSQAILKALLQIKDQKSNIAVSFAERQKSYDMIAGRVRQLASFRRKFLKSLVRKGFKGGGYELLQEVGKTFSPLQLHNLWLEMRYGWMPTLLDIKGSAELLAAHYVDPEYFRFGKSVTLDQESSVQLYWNGYYWKGNYVVDTSTTTTAKCGGFVKVENRNARDLARGGLTNPLELAWEVIPYSFIVDWVISVGDYVEAMSALTGVSVVGGFLSTIVETEVTKTWVSDSSVSSGPGNRWVYLQTPETWSRKRSYTRSAYVPSIRDVSLSSLVSPKLNSKRFIDSVALLANLFTRKG